MPRCPGIFLGAVNLLVRCYRSTQLDEECLFRRLGNLLEKVPQRPRPKEGTLHVYVLVGTRRGHAETFKALDQRCTGS